MNYSRFSTKLQFIILCSGYLLFSQTCHLTITTMEVRHQPVTVIFMWRIRNCRRSETPSSLLLIHSSASMANTDCLSVRVFSLNCWSVPVVCRDSQCVAFHLNTCTGLPNTNSLSVLCFVSQGDPLPKQTLSSALSHDRRNVTQGRTWYCFTARGWRKLSYKVLKLQSHLSDWPCQPALFIKAIYLNVTVYHAKMFSIIFLTEILIIFQVWSEKDYLCLKKKLATSHPHSHYFKR